MRALLLLLLVLALPLAAAHPRDDVALVAFEPTGDARGALIAVSLTGDADADGGCYHGPLGGTTCTGEVAAISVLGNASSAPGGLSFSVLGRCDGRACYSITPQGDADAAWIAVAPSGSATSTYAAVGHGDAAGRLLAVSVAGRASGFYAFSGTGDADAIFVGASALGDARGMDAAVSGTGTSNSTLVAVSGTGDAGCTAPWSPCILAVSVLGRTGEGAIVGVSACEAASVCREMLA